MSITYQNVTKRVPKKRKGKEKKKKKKKRGGLGSQPLFFSKEIVPNDFLLKKTLIKDLSENRPCTETDHARKKET